MDAIYRSEINRDVAPAAEGEFDPLRLGSLEVWPPVVLAPMAGVTNYPFRAICRQQGAGLYVSEMITARPLVEGNRKTLKLSDFGEDEEVRSLQLYGVDPHYLGMAARRTPRAALPPELPNSVVRPKAHLNLGRTPPFRGKGALCAPRAEVESHFPERYPVGESSCAGKGPVHVRRIRSEGRQETRPGSYREHREGDNRQEKR